MTDDRTDQDLCLRIAAGDEQAFTTLYRRHAASVRGLVRRSIADAGRAEDLVQEVFLDVWRGAARFDPTRARFATWLRTIVSRRVIDSLRRASVRPELDGGSTVEAIAPDGTGGVIDALALSDALRDLPDTQRRTLVLAFVFDLSYGEIGRRTGTPLGTIKSRAAAGLRALREPLAVS